MKINKCFICNKRFAEAGTHWNHIQRQCKEVSEKCKPCDETFNKPGILNNLFFLQQENIQKV